MKRTLLALGLALSFVLGGAMPAQAATYGSGNSWNCSVRVSHVGASLYKSELFCPIGSIWKKKVKVSESYFVWNRKPVLV